MYTLNQLFHKANFPLLIVDIPFTYKGTADVDTMTLPRQQVQRLD